MSKRYIFIGAAVIFMILAAACSGQAPAATESPVIVQDVMLGADDTAEEPDMAMPPDAVGSTQSDADALAEEKDYLQKQIDTLNEKLENLKWLRESYVQENPADLESKLAECDALIADAQTELTELQNRMTRNEQDQGESDGDEPAATEDLQQEGPMGTPIESQEPASGESVPVS